jgi:hypothetical protein
MHERAHKCKVIGRKTLILEKLAIYGKIMLKCILTLVPVSGV